MIDWERVSVLRMEFGQDEFSEIADMFLEEVAEGLALLGACPTAARPDALHAIRGAALNLGFSELARACGRLESDLRDDDALITDSLIQVFEASKLQFFAGAPTGAEPMSGRI